MLEEEYIDYFLPLLLLPPFPLLFIFAALFLCLFRSRLSPRRSRSLLSFINPQSIPAMMSSAPPTPAPRRLFFVFSPGRRASLVSSHSFLSRAFSASLLPVSATPTSPRPIPAPAPMLISGTGASPISSRMKASMARKRRGGRLEVEESVGGGKVGLMRGGR